MFPAAQDPVDQDRLTSLLDRTLPNSTPSCDHINTSVTAPIGVPKQSIMPELRNKPIANKVVRAIRFADERLGTRFGLLDCATIELE